ncbi:MAG: hypothetical protein PVJ92_00840, partial [Candidatus Dependentiae bacterium]
LEPHHGQWIQSRGTTPDGASHFSISDKTDLFPISFLSLNDNKAPIGWGHSQVTNETKTQLRSYWLAYDNGVVSVGAGESPGINTQWAWPLFGASTASLEDFSITSATNPLADLFDLSFTSFNGSAATQEKIAEYCGPQEARKVVAATTHLTTDSQHVLKHIRSWLGWQSPTESWAREKVDLTARRKVSLVNKMSNVPSNKWVTTFRMLNAHKVPLHFEFTDVGNKVTILKLTDRYASLKGPIHREAGFASSGQIFTAQKYDTPFTNSWKAAPDESIGGPGTPHSISINYVKLDAPRNSVFEPTRAERDYWLAQYENYLAFGWGTTPSKDSIVFAWPITPEGSAPFMLKELTVSMPAKDHMYARAYRWNSDTQKHEYFYDYSRAGYKDFIQAIYGLAFIPAKASLRTLCKEKIETFVMAKDPTEFEAYKDKWQSKLSDAKARGLRSYQYSDIQNKVNDANTLEKIRTAIGWDKPADLDLRPGMLSIHNLQEDNVLRQEMLPAPGACHLRFNTYNSEKLSVQLLDAEGNALHDVRVGWGNGIALEGTDKSNADYAPPAGSNTNKLWIDYHNKTLTIGSIDEEGKPVVQLTTTDEQNAPIASFRITESSTQQRTQLAMLSSTTFAPPAFTDAFLRSLSFGDKPLSNDIAIPVPAGNAKSWVMYFDTNKKTPCTVSVDSGNQLLHRLELGRWDFLAAAMTSAVPEAHTQGRYGASISNGMTAQDDVWREENGVTKDEWQITESTEGIAVESIVHGYGPGTKYLQEPTEEGGFSTHWIMYHDNMMAFGHGDVAGQRTGYIWQPTIQRTAPVTQARLQLNEGTVRNIRVEKGSEETAQKILNNYTALVATDKGASSEVIKILNKQSSKTVFHVDAGSKLKRAHSLLLPPKARNEQRFACTFKTSSDLVIPGFSAVNTPGIYEYWIDINTGSFSGKITSYYHDADGNTSPQVMQNYAYQGAIKKWTNENVDRNTGAAETIQHKRVTEDDAKYPHIKLKKDADMWLVFNKGWLAYGHGTDIGKNIGVVWYFTPSKHRRPINYLTMTTWASNANYYDVTFLEPSEEKWRESRAAYEARFEEQLPASDAIALAIRTRIASSRPDTVTIPAQSDEAREIALPSGSTQSWVCTFNAVHQKGADGSHTNKDLRFFIDTHVDAEDPLKNSAFIVRKNTDYTQFINDPGKKLADGTTRGNVINQLYRLNRESSGVPFDVWTTSGRENNHYLSHLWVNGGDNGRFGINNNNGRIHGATRDADGNNTAQHWIAYHQGYVATGLGAGPQVTVDDRGRTSFSNIGMIWKMKPHLAQKDGGPRQVQGLRVTSADKSPVLLTHVNTRQLNESDSASLEKGLNSMISATRQGRVRGGIDKPGLDLVNHMRQEVGLPSEKISLSDNKLLLARPIRTHYVASLPQEQLDAQKFIVSFTAKTRSRLFVSPLDKDNKGLAPFFISQWLAEGNDNKVTAGILGKIMNQEFGDQYVKKSLDGGFDTAKGADKIAAATSNETYISIKNQPLTIDGAPNPALTIPGKDQAYWFYYDGEHLSFGHGSKPSEGSVGFTWKLLEPLSAAIYGFAFYADVNLILTPPISFHTPTEADVSAVTKAITNADLAAAFIGEAIQAPLPDGASEKKEEEVKEETIETETADENKEKTELTTDKTTEEKIDTTKDNETKTDEAKTDEAKTDETKTEEEIKNDTVEGAEATKETTTETNNEKKKEPSITDETSTTKESDISNDTKNDSTNNTDDVTGTETKENVTTTASTSTEKTEPEAIVTDPRQWQDIPFQGDDAQQFIMRFSAHARSNFSIALGGAESDAPVYALELGATKIAGSRIFKGKETPHVSFADVSIASTAVPINYWLAYHRETVESDGEQSQSIGHFSLGQGVVPGGSVLFNWQDSSPVDFTRCKLVGSQDTTFKNIVFVEDTGKLDELRTQQATKYIAMGNSGAFNQWRSDWTFSVPGSGRLTFSARSANALHIGLATQLPTEKGSQVPLYEMVIDRSSSRVTTFKKDGIATGPVLSREALLPRDTLAHPYWLTYDSDTQLLTFGKGDTPGENELIRKEIENADATIRHFSFTNSDAGAIYTNVQYTPIIKTGADFHKANPGNGLAKENEWKNEWQFTETANTTTFDVKGANGAVIVLGPNATSPANSYRIRLSKEFAADVIEGEDDRNVKEVAQDEAASLLPADDALHSFWIQRENGEGSTTLKLGTWAEGETKTEKTPGSITLVTWEDKKDPVAVNAFTFAAYDAPAFVENIKVFAAGASANNTAATSNDTAAQTTEKATAANIPAQMTWQEAAQASRSRNFTRARSRGRRSSRSALESRR